MSRAPSHRRGLERWLVIPATVGLFVLVGVAISTEDQPASTSTGSAADQPEQAEADPTPDTAGATPDTADPTPDTADPTPETADPTPETADPTPETTNNPEEGDVADVSRGDVAGSRAANDGASFEVHGLAGHVTITVGKGSNPAVQPGAVEESSPASVDFIGANTEQGSGGLRLQADGSLVPVDVEDVAAGDLAIKGVADGINLLGTDGSSRVEVRPTGDGGLTVTEVSPTGLRRSLTPDSNARIDLDDGLSIHLQGAPPASEDTPADEPKSLWEQLTETAWRWVLLALLAMILLAALAVGYLRRGDDDSERTRVGYIGPDGTTVEHFDEFVDMLRNDPDPARALRFAFFAAERGLGDLPPRLSTETPFEWCDRSIVGRPHISQPLRSLCDRYVTARFAAEQPSEQDRDAAIVELLDLNEQATSQRTRAQAATEPVGIA